MKKPKEKDAPFSCDEDYRTALKEIESLWGCSPGTPEAERFEELAKIVERYEEEHFPMVDEEPPY